MTTSWQMASKVQTEKNPQAVVEVEMVALRAQTTTKPATPINQGNLNLHSGFQSTFQTL